MPWDSPVFSSKFGSCDVPSCLDDARGALFFPTTGGFPPFYEGAALFFSLPRGGGVFPPLFATLGGGVFSPPPPHQGGRPTRLKPPGFGKLNGPPGIWWGRPPLFLGETPLLPGIRFWERAPFWGKKFLRSFFLTLFGALFPPLKSLRVGIF